MPWPWYADAPLQWGRRQTSTERGFVRFAISPSSGASMGPPTNVDGELSRVPLSRVPLSSFNGAADKRRRRGDTGPACAARYGAASMGPPTNVDGELESASLESASLELQWGRRQTSTERLRVRGGQRGHRRASMGPPTNVDGEPCLSLTAPWAVSGFNGAADKRRRRGARRARRGEPGEQLQWGRRQTSTERRNPMGAAWSSALLQWGRRQTSTERCPHFSVRRRIACFNGAADKRRRRDSELIIL